MSDLSKQFAAEEDLSKSFNALPGDKSAPDEYSTLGATAMGGLKGVTAGFDDEIGGIAKALWDKNVTGKKEDFWDLYTKVRDSIRDEHKASEEQHPIASTVGEIGGGVLGMAAIPEAIIGKAAAAGAGMMTKAKALGAMGARAGAIAGLGNSTADLTKGQVGQAATDTAGGAASGALIGGVAMPAVEGMVGGAAKGAWNIAKQFPVVGENMDIFRKAASGIDLMGMGNDATANANNVAGAIADSLETLRSTAGVARQDAINAASDTGVKVGTKPWYDKWMAESESKMSSASEDQVQEIRDFQKHLKSVMQESETPVTSTIPLEPKDVPNQDHIAMGKVESTMTKKSLADKEQANQIEKALDEKIKSGEIDPNDEDDMQRMQGILGKVKALREGNEFNPEVQTDSGTGQEGIVNARGENKTPVVEHIKPVKITPFDANVAEIKGKLIEQGRTEMTPTEMSKLSSDLNKKYMMYDKMPGKDLSKSFYQGAKKDIQGMIEKAADLSPDTKETAVADFNDALKNYQGETGNFINVAKTQETLNQPGFSTIKDGEGNVLKLQTMIQNYNKPGSMARQTLDKAIFKLEESYPQEAAGMKELIQDVSTNRDLAMGLASQSPLATNLVHASAKAITMNLARISGMAYGGILKYGGSAAKDSSGALVNIGNAIYGASPDTIQSMADKGAAMGGAFGSMISKTLGAIADAPQFKQRAVLFTLMQQPDFRKFVQEQMSEEPK